jgi:hypothetical protein
MSDRAPRLIFVEGMPGAGKSTTAQFIARRLVRRGHAARWIHEEEEPHPLVPDPPEGGYTSWGEFIERRIARWRAFAGAAMDDDGTTVIDGALLQGLVLTMFRRNADAALVEAAATHLVDAVSSLHPALIYLARRHPEAALRAIVTARGAEWIAWHVKHQERTAYARERRLQGETGLFAYWQAHTALCDRIAQQLSLPTLKIDVDSGSWTEHRRGITDFVVAARDEYLPGEQTPADLTRFVGQYRSAHEEVTVFVDDDHLALTGVLWPVNRLLPQAPAVFDVESWPFRVSFDVDEGGEAAALHWEGPRLRWGGPAGVFSRSSTRRGT